MDNFKHLKAYQQLQSGVMFDRLIDLGFAVINYCQEDKTIFWNLAVTDNNLDSGQLQQIEDKMSLLNRQPAVYFEDKPTLKNLADFLKKQNFQPSFKESWMFYSGQSAEDNQFRNIKKVENPADLKVFLTTFDACYQENDPQNPYGKVNSGYMKTTENVWNKFKETDRLEYFIGYKDEKPVAVATLNNFEDYGYISNVGSLPEVRGQGFGKMITLYCVNASKEKGHNYHFLITEEGSYPNEFYKRIGFETKFEGVCFSKPVEF